MTPGLQSASLPDLVQAGGQKMATYAQPAVGQTDSS